jgi:hypothetical protein
MPVKAGARKNRSFAGPDRIPAGRCFFQSGPEVSDKLEQDVADIAAAVSARVAAR